MSRKKATSPAIAEMLTGNGQVTTELDKACWLRIKPAGEVLGEIEVGNRNRDASEHAVTWASDAYRFNRYGGPGTDYANGVHVYLRCANSAYTEDGATVLIDGEWWSADVHKPNGKVTIKPARKLDPISHKAEIVAQRKEWGQDLARQNAAGKAEEKRANADANRIAKHAWGEFTGYAFKIWLAHKRQLLQHYFVMVNQPDDEKAAAMRGKSIDDAINYDEFVAPIKRAAAKEVAAEIKTDAPDNVEGESEETPAPVSGSLVFPFVLNGLIYPKKPSVDLFELPLKVGLTVCYSVRGNGYKEAPRSFYSWDPSNDRQVAELRGFAADPMYAITCDPRLTNGIIPL